MRIAKGGARFGKNCGYGHIRQEVVDREGQDGQRRCLNTDSIAQLLFWGLMRVLINILVYSLIKSFR
jgi:hypothetical protein